jgi:putative transposase
MIDDHSRLIPHAQFYLAENLDSFRDCLLAALEKRGLPRKLYVDNGSVFRSHKLKYACARLGIALLHATPYTPEGKGKIERFFRTLRQQFLPLIQDPLSLAQLNEQLAGWLDGDYHARLHASTGQTPLQRYLAHLSLLRPAPRDLRDYFRTPVRRKVDKDRTVSLHGKVYEAPVGLIGKMVTLLFHEQDPTRIEVVLEETSHGFLVPLNTAVNSRIRRAARQQTELLPAAPSAEKTTYRGGSLFEPGDRS